MSNIRSKILRRSVTYLCVFCLYRPWDYPESFGIYSQLDRKSKTCFFTILNVYVSWIEGTKSLPHSFYLQNLGILQPRLDQRGRTPWKWILKIQIQKWVSWTGMTWKVEEKMGSFVWFSCLISELWSLNCQKFCLFCNLVLCQQNI